jgi:hypothetical protein
MTASHWGHRELPGMTEAKRALAARKGPATEADRPLRQSRPPRQIPGQLDLFRSGTGRTTAAEEAAERRKA